MTDAATIARALGGKPIADGFLCRCPVPGHGKGNGDRNRSLIVKDGERAPLFKCFAGCSARDVLDALRPRGLIDDDGSGNRGASPTPFAAPVVHEPDPEALKIWRDASPAAGSIVESYLRSRGILLAVPPTLRCGFRLRFGCEPAPTMIAAVQRPDGKIVAVQVTTLTGAGMKAPGPAPRITTGALGAGAVRFAKAGDALGIAEGAETALAAMQLADVPCWACFGAGRMHRVAIPASVRELHIFADNDDPGKHAANLTAHANRHRRIVLRYPPAGCKDWNDALVALGMAAA
jgi:putative DNA primase/helicase